MQHIFKMLLAGLSAQASPAFDVTSVGLSGNAFGSLQQRFQLIVEAAFKVISFDLGFQIELGLQKPIFK